MVSSMLLLALSTAAAAPPSSQPAAEDEQAIRRNVSRYVEAYNDGDLDTVAGLYAPKAEYRMGSQVVRGREAIAEKMKERYKAGNTLDVKVDSVRLLRPGMIIERGTATMKPREGEPITEDYRVVHQKQPDGKWLIQSVGPDTRRGMAVDRTALEPLAWMVGRWKDARDDVDIEMVCSWTDNERFLLSTYIVREPDQPELKVSQVIGWDPADQGVRSWVFDSDGGFGQSTWRERQGDWLIQAKAVLPDGGRASAIQILHPVDENSFTWSSTNREVNDSLLPDIEDIKFVRAEQAAADASRGRQP
jgi:uncharacterized protein (TIGR02246 family)